jgi:hypothetical protein
MADYNKATNFTAKDGLPSGNAGKIVKGTEIDIEFTAIASAIASKADINSPALTGTPTAPTATAGSNTTQLANTAFVKQEIVALGLGTMSTQNKTAVDITGGTIVGITDLAVADGGTGASTFTANSVVLGNGTSALNGNMVAPSTSGNLLTSNGTTWQSSAPLGVGLGQTWSDQTTNRVAGTTYTNSTGKPIVFTVSGISTAASASIYGYVNGVFLVFGSSSAGANTLVAGFTLVVPNGATYKADIGNCYISIWSELR